MASLRKTERLLNLIAFFLNAREPKSLEEISKIEGYRGKSPEALRQSFYRDRKELAQMGVLISYDPIEEGYYLPSEKKYLPRINFTLEDITALRLLKQLVEESAYFPWRDELRIGLQKILLEAEPEEEPNFSLPLAINLKTYNQQDEVSKEIEQAIMLRKEISFFYRAPREKKAKEWVVQPYLLFQKEKAWYLVAYSPEHSDYRTFRLSRIQGEVKILNEDEEEPDFQRDPNFKPEKFFFMFPWEYGSAKPIEVKVRFSPKAAFLVEKSFSRKLAQEADGSEVLLFEVKDEEAFVQWLLSFAEDAEVLSPVSTRKKIYSALNRIEGVYKNGQT